MNCARHRANTDRAADILAIPGRAGNLLRYGEL